MSNEYEELRNLAMDVEEEVSQNEIDGGIDELEADNVRYELDKYLDELNEAESKGISVEELSDEAVEMSERLQSEDPLMLAHDLA